MGQECSICAIINTPLPATSRCLDCRDFLCQSCTQGHRCTRTTLHHSVVDLKEFMDGKHDAEVRLRQTMCCLDHELEPLRFFCKTCNAPICRDCCLLTHRPHEYESLTGTIEQKKQEVRRLIDDLQGHLQMIVDWEQNVEGSLGMLSRAEVMIRENITSYADDIIALIQGQRAAALQKLDAFLMAESQALQATKQNLQEQREKAVSSRDFSQKVMDMGNDCEILFMEGTMQNRFQALQLFSPQLTISRQLKLVRYGQLMVSKMQFFNLVFCEDDTKGQSVSPSYNADIISTRSLFEKKAPSNLNSAEAQFIDPQPTGLQLGIAQFTGSQLKNSTESQSEPESTQSGDSFLPGDRMSMRCIRTFDLKQNHDEYIPTITSISMGPGAEDILLVDRDNYEIKWFSIQGNLMKTIKVEEIYGPPCSVTICGDKIACSTQGYILYLTLEGNCKARQKLSNYQSRQLYPITSHKSEYVAVSESTNCSVALYNTLGRRLDRIQPSGYRGGKFLFISINSREEFIVSDTIKKHIVIFKRSGHLVRTLDATNSLLCNPFSLCVDDSHIYVCDCTRLIQFRDDGQDGLMIQISTPQEIIFPRLLAVDRSGRLIVVQKNNYVRVNELY